MAEQLRFNQLLGNGGAIDFHKRPVAAQAGGVQRPGDQLLARAAFAIDQDATIGRGGQRDLLPQGLHRHAFADHLAALLELRAQPAVFFLQAQVLERVFHHQDGFFEGKRFFDEIKGAELGGAHRSFNVAVAGDHHYHWRRNALLQPLQCH